jgi:hypothetical protein
MLSVGWPLIFSVPAFAIFTGFGLHALRPDRADQVEIVTVTPIGFPVKSGSGSAWASDALGYPEADGRPASEVGAAEVALKRRIKVQ